MKFDCSIIIEIPILDVVKSFEDPEALKQSQKGFLRIEHISGDKANAGAKSKLVYNKFDLIETIIYNKLPDEFFAKYEHKNMTNTMKSKFTSLTNDQTKLTTSIEYTYFSGFVIKIMARFFPKMFKKQVEKWLVKFKLYCENH